MRKNLFVSITLLAAALSSCSQTEEPGSEAKSVEIRIGSQVLATLTKAPVTKAPVTTGTEFTAAITAFELDGNGTPAWTTEPADGSWWQNSLTLSAATTAASPVSLDVSRNYHATRTTWLAAWHPQVASAGGIATFSGMDGTTDVMWGGIVHGSKQSPIATAFTFTHALAQLNFQARAAGDYLTDGTGVTVSKIEVVNAQLPKSLTIADGVLTYATAADIPVPGKETAVKSAPAVPLKLTATAADFGASLMIAAMDEVKVKVTYTDSGDEKTATATIRDTTNPAASLKLVAGSSHRITLQLGKNDLQLTASVAEWNIGSAGNIEFP